MTGLSHNLLKLEHEIGLKTERMKYENIPQQI